MSLLTIEEPADGTETMQFSMENFMPKLYEIFKQAVLSNNYPVIGLFMVGGGAMLKIINADLPIFTFTVPGSVASPILNYLSLWAGLATGGRQIGSVPNVQLPVTLSELLIAAGIGLLGSPLIGKAQSLLP